MPDSIPELLLHTDISLSGAWHFTPEKLQALDEVVDDIRNGFQKDRSRRIGTALKLTLARNKDALAALSADERNEWKKKERRRIADSYPFDEDSRATVIDFKSKREIQSDCFAAVLNKPELAGEMPVGFRVSVKCARHELRVRFDGNPFGGLYIRAEPRGSPLSADAINRIVRWAEQARLPRALSIWRELAGFQWMLFFFVVLVSITYATGAAKRAAQHSLKREAHELLRGGVESNEEKRAIEILLSLQTDFDPGGVRSADRTFWEIMTWLIPLFLLALGFHFAPSTAIGVGLGARKLRRQRTVLKWMKVLFTVVVLAIAVSVIGNLITDWVKSQFLRLT